MECLLLMGASTHELSKYLFHVAAPEAKEVLLVGDFTNWSQQAIPMLRQPSGIWTALVPLSPGPHRYRFIVDGQCLHPPQSISQVPDPLGAEDLVREAA